MFCVHCGNKLDDDAAFCSNCGKNATEKATKEEIKFCKKCGAELEADSVFCANCGSKVWEEKNERKPASSSKKTPKTKTTKEQDQKIDPVKEVASPPETIKEQESVEDKPQVAPQNKIETENVSYNELLKDIKIKERAYLLRKMYGEDAYQHFLQSRLKEKQQAEEQTNKPQSETDLQTKTPPEPITEPAIPEKKESEVERWKSAFEDQKLKAENAVVWAFLFAIAAVIGFGIAIYNYSLLNP